MVADVITGNHANTVLTEKINRSLSHSTGDNHILV